jgi:succinoglycan biosynthesis protein ExoA
MPKVSIIVPCYNEERTITLLLDAILQQTYPARDMEVVIADALSTDRTRARIESFHAVHPELAINIVDNPRRTIPSALNEALNAAQGETIVRLDAHCVPRPDYVERCVAALQAGFGENVGGVWDIKPGAQDWIGRSIAVAAAHPLGVGDAQYRHTQRAQVVDTVPFGSFRRELIQRIGFYDEDLLSNEDYEWNARLHQIGGKVWLDPAICSTYFARPNLGALVRQYARYGFWKVRMLRRYPTTLRWRQALPPLFVLGILGLAGLGIFFRWALLLLVALLGIYLLILLGVGIQTARQQRDIGLLLGVPIAIASMHLTWGSSFLWSLVNVPMQRRPAPAAPQTVQTDSR